MRTCQATARAAGSTPKRNSPAVEVGVEVAVGVERVVEPDLEDDAAAGGHGGGGRWPGAPARARGMTRRSRAAARAARAGPTRRARVPTGARGRPSARTGKQRPATNGPRTGVRGPRDPAGLATSRVGGSCGLPVQRPRVAPDAAGEGARSGSGHEDGEPGHGPGHDPGVSLDRLSDRRFAPRATLGDSSIAVSRVRSPGHCVGRRVQGVQPSRDRRATGRGHGEALAVPAPRLAPALLRARPSWRPPRLAQSLPRRRAVHDDGPSCHATFGP